jgi:hypothetical protein
MGTLEYNSSRPPIEVDDALLAHLKVVISTKLRRQESFMMTWTSADDDHRLTAWVHPSIPLVLEFAGAKIPRIDPTRIERMMSHLNSRGELVIDENS